MMKPSIVLAAGIAACFFLLTAAHASSDTTISSLTKRVTDAQKQVDQAQVEFTEAQARAESGMSSSDKADWRGAQSKYDSLVAGGSDPHKISDQKQVLVELESRVMKPSDQESVDHARNNLAEARGVLDRAQTRLRRTQRQTHDDSSQTRPPENRTSNGANFSIRSERDAENHPPLPAPQ